MKNFYFRNIKVGQVREAVFKVNMFYEKEKAAKCNFPPSLTGVYVNNVVSGKSDYAIYIEGLDNKPVKDIHITDCNFENVEKEYFVKNTKDLHVDNTTVNGKKVEIK
jgi:uncharacterized protein (UPF0276 family)